VYADIRAGGFLWVLASNHSRVVNDGIFGDLGGYFFANFRDKARPATLHGDMLPLVGM